MKGKVLIPSWVRFVVLPASADKDSEVRPPLNFSRFEIPILESSTPLGLGIKSKSTTIPGLKPGAPPRRTGIQRLDHSVVREFLGHKPEIN